MDGFSAIWQGLDWSVLTTALLSVIPILICLTIHELAHGVTAYALGDDTAKRMGRLTLNPLRHIDPVGLLMMLLVRFGWAKPVPVDMRNFKRPRAYMAISALAGPLSNFLFTAFILLFQMPLIRLLEAGGFRFYLADTILITAMLSLFLGLFNLLPIPPLDGSKILFSVLPKAQHDWLMRYEKYGMILLIALIWLGFTSGPLFEIVNTLWRWMLDFMRGPSTFLFGG